MGRLDTRSAVRIAMAGAVFIMAYQVAGKAARDALFLTSYRPSQLPPMVVAGALSAILLGVLNSRPLTRFPPGRFIPALLLFSAALQAVEWVLYPKAPGPVAIAVYIHVVSLGAVITSGFWSVINEQFDPYTAKQNFGYIAGAGTVGGVAGGFASERLAVYAPEQSVLLAMVVAQLMTGLLLFRLPGSTAPVQMQGDRARDLLRHSGYLRNLTLLVLTGTFSAALLDYVLKSDARHTLGPGEPLLRFFAIFYTGTAVLSFLLQTGVTTAFLNRMGLGAAVSTLPASVTGTGVIAGLAGGFPLVIMARAVESVVRGSIFRAGYELLYTPMIASEKRAMKSINDVTVDRLGDALGGGFAQLAISLGPVLSGRVMLITASLVSAGGLLLARRVQDGYVGSLERSLQHYAGDEAQIEDPGLRELPPASKGAPLERSMLPFVIPKLASASTRESAMASLETVARANVGQISDYLLDPATDVHIRRLLPALLACAGGDRAADALIRGLEDEHAEVRIQCARALDFMKQAGDAEIEPGRVYDVVQQELMHPRSRRGPDLGHVFVLLSLILPREPVRIAFEALGTTDPHLRGLALEYLETALPPDVWTALLAAIDALPSPEHLRLSLASAAPQPTDLRWISSGR